MCPCEALGLGADADKVLDEMANCNAGGNAGKELSFVLTDRRSKRNTEKLENSTFS
jgi:hypothetical protein